MKRIFSSVSLVVMLGGCAHFQSPIILHPEQHHAVKPKFTPPPVYVPPPAPVVPPKKSFKDRWESKFFRDRALRK